MNRLKQTVYLITVLALAASCAREVPEDSDTLEQHYIEAYIKTNYPDKKPEASGLYFLSHTENSAGTPTAANDMVYIRYTSRTLSGNVAETSDSTIAMQLGAHSYTVYYGPKLFSLAEGATLVGIREALLSMKTGEKVSILMPSKLSTTGVSASRLYSAPMLYDLELFRVVPDITTFQTDSLEHYKEKYYSGAEAIQENVYFATLKNGTDEPPAADDTVIVRYVGALLDGFVFDTNIKDTAQLHYRKNFDKTATYDALTVIIKDEVSSMDVVQGFAYALQRMKAEEEAVVFFSSDYGYQTTTSGQIQPYSMLRFYIKLEHIGRVQ
ncbi:MAG: FKBP-type peptidyl-prolyl cis-trans isomerase [Prevotellaceae bacterium]|jgi:FKBP-type peptidyl-prolyl cis-trans isomerase|nr:FKBP-type peptidyl-prolyl cis-trans isomerase [Prevotellaceae bacterium]